MNEHDARRECYEIFSRLSEYSDGELGPDMCGWMEEHLDDCPPCQVFLESLKRTVRLLADTGAGELPESMREEIREAYQRLRRDNA